MNQTPEQRLAALGISLPDLTAPRGSFVTYVRSGTTIYLSGKGSPLRPEGEAVPKVGAAVSVSEARQCARDVAIYLLAAMREALGGFENLHQLVKVFGMVNATPDFTEHTEVINGASDLFVDVLGADRGAHARSAVGVGSLPRGFAVEIEAIVEQVSASCDRVLPLGVAMNDADRANTTRRPPDGLPTYRLLTGVDDAAFCRRVSEAVSLGYVLYGSPAATFNGQSVIVAQAVIWPDAHGGSAQPPRY
jgi:enamine deaminase RidA (YjgF/YER057c/UK114 family)